MLQIRSWGSTFAAEEMQSIFLRLLMKPEGGVAALALKCLVAFKLPYVSAYRESLERLAGDKTYARACTRRRWFVCVCVRVCVCACACCRSSRSSQLAWATRGLLWVCGG